VTSVNESTRPESRFLVTRTRLVSRWELCWFDSTRVIFFAEWLDSSHNQWLDSSHNQWLDSSQSHFYKISEPLMDKPGYLHTKKWAFVVSVMITIGENFPFWLSSHVMLHFKDQVLPITPKTLLFNWGARRAEYIDTLSWFNVAFAHCDHGSRPYRPSVTLSLFQIKWFKFLKSTSNPKLYCKTTQIRKSNLV